MAAAPELLDIPVGIDAQGSREESDAMGTVQVPADRYWGAQTQRSLHFFEVGALEDRMPLELIRAYALVKKAVARVNAASGQIPDWMGELIERVCDEVAGGDLDSEFPLQVWQSGSGTQTNMNLNEVIANRCNQLVGAPLGSRAPVHPNDHVNMSQSTNDTFPTAMHVATTEMLQDLLSPRVGALRDSLEHRSELWADVVKVGRTHLQDATPLTVGQEWSGYAAMVGDALGEVVEASRPMLALAVGGTAVGTGLNTTEGFDREVAAEIAGLTGRPFVSAPNKFAALGSLDASVRCSGALRGLAASLFKIANDLRWLGSGPRSGLGELDLPANEPGSSIMPGKVNPTQAEVMQMVAVQVMGNDVTIAMAGKEGNLELNTFRPVVIANLLRGIRILGDACEGFRRHLIEGVELDRRRIDRDVERSVMGVTALAPLIGHDVAAQIAQLAVAEDLTLREAALRRGVEPDVFDEVVVPIRLTRPRPTQHLENP
jgi:fumarate hydratase class II